jgi:hypothetical protein
MRVRCCLLGIVLLSTLVACTTPRHDETATDEQAIGAIYDQYSAAVRSRNVDAIMGVLRGTLGFASSIDRWVATGSDW